MLTSSPAATLPEGEEGWIGLAAVSESPPADASSPLFPPHASLAPPPHLGSLKPLLTGTASVNLALNLAQPSVISAEATFQLAAADVPFAVARAAGPADPVTHVRAAAAGGEPARVTYLTRAGRELALE